VVHYNPLMPEILEDPYAVYKQLRAEAPVYFVEEFDCWALSLFDDIWEQSGDSKSYSAALRGTTPAHLITKQLPVFPSVNMMDPPEHVRNRALISGAFKPKRVEALAPAIQGVVDETIDALRGRDEFDLVADYIAKIAIKSSCLLLGLPVEDGDLLYSFVNRFFDREPGRPGMMEDGLKAADELNAYLEAIIKERRKRPSDDDVLLNAYLNAQFDGKPIPDENVASQMSTLVIGSTDSFPKIFASGALELYRSPEQRAELVTDPAQIPDAFREALRYGMPTQFLGRNRDLPLPFGESRRAGVRRSGSLRHPPAVEADPDLRPRQSLLPRDPYLGARGRDGPEGAPRSRSGVRGPGGLRREPQERVRGGHHVAPGSRELSPFGSDCPSR
jgi:cytochrome P450